MGYESAKFDVIIIGGGPGGLSAALWCADLGLRTAIFERENEFGGQLLLTFNRITNYLGVRAADGRELRGKFLKSIDKIECHRFAGRAVTGVDLARKIVTIGADESYAANSIIIATGVRRRALSIPGEEEFAGRGILFSGVNSAEIVRRKRVVIVGGGDAALENAFVLSKTADQVTIIHRRGKLRARPDFVARATPASNVSLMLGATVTEILGNESVEAVRVAVADRSGETLEIPTDFLLIRIGVLPNTEILRGSLDLDADGYVVIDQTCRTSAAGVFAIGDVTNPIAPTVAAAVGQGSIAAKTLYRYVEPL